MKAQPDTKKLEREAARVERESRALLLRAQLVILSLRANGGKR